MERVSFGRKEVNEMRIFINIENDEVWTEPDLKKFFEENRASMGDFGTDDFETFLRHATDRNGSLREV